MVQLVERILYESEEQGILNLLSHESLSLGKLLTFTIQNKITQSLPEFSLKILDNKTIFDLRTKIAEILNVKS